MSNMPRYRSNACYDSFELIYEPSSDADTSLLYVKQRDLITWRDFSSPTIIASLVVCFEASNGGECLEMFTAHFINQKLI
jgi:hypothetical protein